MEENNQDKNSNIGGAMKENAKETGKNVAKEIEKKGKKTLKKLWKKIPLVVRLKIYAIATLVVAVVIIILAAVAYIKGLFSYEKVIEIFTDIFKPASTSSDSTTTETITVELEPAASGNTQPTWTTHISQDKIDELEEAGVDTTDKTSDELIIELLRLNGITEDHLTDEQVEKLPYYLKAGIASQYPDVRTVDEMYDSTTNQYKTLTTEEISENLNNDVVCGTVHFRRVNTTDISNPIILSYIDYDTFKSYTQKTNPTQSDYDAVKNYFSINDNNEIVIANWSHNVVTYTFKDGTKTNPYTATDFANSDTYTLSELVVNYKSLISRYSLPFEVLLALLINSDDIDFTTKIADLAFNSNIEVTIVEEATQTDTLYTTEYYEKTRNYQYIGLYGKVAGTDRELAPQDLKFLEGNNDTDTDSTEDVVVNDKSTDEASVAIELHKYLTGAEDLANCTYKKQDTNPSYTVEQNVHREQNLYKYGITLADTWFAKIEKPISSNKQNTPIGPNESTFEDQYNYSQTIESDNNNIPADIDKQFLEAYYNSNKNTVLQQTKQDYKNETQLAYSISDDGTNTTISIGNSNDVKEIILDGTKYTGTINKIDENTYFYELSIAATGASKIEIVDIYNNKYTFDLSADTGKYVYSSCVAVASTGYDQSTIIYEKTDTKTIETGTQEKYELVEQNATTDLYEDKTEKFLKAYDESPKAQGNMSSTTGWVQEYIDSYDPNYTIIINYLLAKYNGEDTSRYDISQVLDIYNLSSFTSFNIGGSGAASFSQFKRWIRAKESHEGLSADGSKYRVWLVDGNRTVGYGIDLETSGKEDEIKALTGMTEIKKGDYIDVDIIDKIEDESHQEAIEAVRRQTNGLNLTEYQIYALVSRVYNCGEYGGFGLGKYKKNGKTWVEAYNAYWNETDDEYGVTENATMYNHLLYSDHMYLPNAGKDVSLTTRRESEWLLFKTGYFDAIDEFCTLANRVSIENINLYNVDGSVNQTEINNLEVILTNQVETRNGEYMQSSHLQYKQCTWWAFSRASQYLGKEYPVDSSGAYGDGAQWIQKNRDNGWFEEGTEPRANSLVCWQNSSYGHVAYVEAVDTVNGKIYISHAGSGKSWYGIEELNIDGIFSKCNPLGYIYLDSPKNFN